MQDKNRVEKVILQKIIKYCDTVEELIQEFNNSYELFLEKKSFQLSCGMCVIQIGELVGRLSADFKEKNSNVDWTGIKAFRNVQAHDYENVDFEIFWRILNKKVPELKSEIEKILEKI